MTTSPVESQGRTFQELVILLDIIDERKLEDGLLQHQKANLGPDLGAIRKRISIKGYGGDKEKITKDYNFLLDCFGMMFYKISRGSSLQQEVQSQLDSRY